LKEGRRVRDILQGWVEGLGIFYRAGWES